MKLIVAVDNEWGIGFKGDLLARVRGDLRNFAALTKGKVIIYGSKTLETFPEHKILKNRVNIVLTRRKNLEAEGAILAASVEEALSLASGYNTDDVFVIGGESVYSQFLEYCDCCYVTKFLKSFEKDAYFPDLDASDEWTLAYRSAVRTTDPETDTIEGMKYVFTRYRRVK
ncbi:MAG: dihydrofolate reductase [Clostridia bacterium]|nr:dihydrofolate reductase [Clostridia bacterium]MBR5007174.1 dihydrofolate reductase [Clostridia bacterium]